MNYQKFIDILNKWTVNFLGSLVFTAVMVLFFGVAWGGAWAVIFLVKFIYFCREETAFQKGLPESLLKD